ncbi:major facilitator superfamily transporter, partial [Xylogone sp. PMI_703]
MAADDTKHGHSATGTTSSSPQLFLSSRSSVNDSEDVDDKVKPPKWSMGILNDPKTYEVPGSVLLLARHNEPLGLQNAPSRTSASSRPSAIPANTHNNKKLTKDGSIVLEPQPDDSHNDPLNWPMWRRDSALLSLGLYCMLGGGMTPVLAAGFTNVAATYGISTARVSLTTGLYMMGLGVGSVLAAPTAILFGKRPVYLIGAIMFILTAVWCALSPNFVSLLIARIFQGIALSPVECLPSATIAEIFFLHERAYRIGIYTLLLLGGKNLVPLISAAIIQSLSWRWVFWIVGMVGGFCWCLIFLFVPETFWDRTPSPHHHNPSIKSVFRRKSVSTSDNTNDIIESPVMLQEGDIEKNQVEDLESDQDRSASTPTKQPGQGHYTAGLRQAPRQTFVQQLKPYNGRLTHSNWFRVAIRPFILFSYPTVLWSSVVYACSVGWLIVLSESVAVIYRSKDTYNFSALSAGLIYLSPFIGGILGTAVAGKISDIIVRAMARRNNGLYEPEFRLVMAGPVAITTVIGLMGFGWSAQIHDNWIVPTIFFGVISFGCSLGSTTAITFCVDSYRQYASEALVTLNFSKNVLHGLVFSLFFTEWLVSDGSKMVFIWIGVIQLILIVFSVPMYIFGKRARMWTTRRNLMEKF